MTTPARRWDGYPKPEPGQIWIDNDPRCKGRRTLRVEAITTYPQQTIAKCAVLTDSNGNPPTRRAWVRIRTDRMIPTSSGYRLQGHDGGAA